jgi:ATP-dependent Clp protease ATP-binding subunit ClpB
LSYRFNHRRAEGFPLQLNRLQQLLSDRKIVLSVDDKAETWLTNTGYDAVNGARPLKHVIWRQLQNPLATMLLSGSLRTATPSVSR